MVRRTGTRVSLILALTIAVVFTPASALAANSPSMDNQVQSLIQTYGPLLVLNFQEQYLLDNPSVMLDGPSTLNWGLVTTTDDPVSLNVQRLGVRETSSETILADEAVAQQDPHSSDPRFQVWLDSDPSLWSGHMLRAKSYVRVLAPDANTLDIQFWFFYAYNGPVKVQASVELSPTFTLYKNFRLENVGRHQGDWEHVTLRFAQSGADWTLQKIFLAQHSGGEWLNADQLSYVGSTHHPIIFSGLDSHASYATTGTQIGELKISQGPLQVHQIDFTRIGRLFATYGTGKFAIVSSDIPGVQVTETPGWFDYTGLWGPYELHVDTASLGPVSMTYPLVDKGPVGPAQHGPDPMP